MKHKTLDKSILLSWTLLALLVFFSSFKEQVFLNESIQKQLSVIFPEGWGFFTKSPRDLIMQVYKIENDTVNSISMSTHSKEAILGLSRKPRVIGYEASIIANEIPKSFWKDNTTNNLTHYINDSTLIIKKNNFKYFKKGDYLFKLYKKVPYAWAKKNQEEFNPFKIARIKIQ